MLEKTSPKLTSFIIIGSLFRTYRGRLPYLDQRSLFGTISFIKELDFDIKNYPFCCRLGTWLSFPRDVLHQKFTQLLSFSVTGIVVKCKLFSSFVH